MQYLPELITFDLRRVFYPRNIPYLDLRNMWKISGGSNIDSLRVLTCSHAQQKTWSEMIYE